MIRHSQWVVNIGTHINWTIEFSDICEIWDLEYLCGVKYHEEFSQVPSKREGENMKNHSHDKKGTENTLQDEFALVCENNSENDKKWK